MTGVNDIVLIHMEDQPLSFARIEAVEPDSFPGHGVQVWGLQDRVAVVADIAIAQVVGHHQDDVGPIARLGVNRRSKDALRDDCDASP